MTDLSEIQLISEEAPLIDLEDLKSWILFEDDHLLIINKPGWVVCHPSKNGPLSSLVGACREYTQLERIHLISRLDRETSGLVLFGKHRKISSSLQSALEGRNVEKSYLSILSGELNEEVLVDQPLAKDISSSVHIKQIVRQDRTSKPAQTFFKSLFTANGYTLAQVNPITGRKHQIRAHAKWLGYPVVGDKLYGPDDTLYLEFIENGWTDRLDKNLPLKRQALHAARLTFNLVDSKSTFFAPLLPDMSKFLREIMLLSDVVLASLLQQL